MIQAKQGQDNLTALIGGVAMLEGARHADGN
jgi:hypothetical protein